MGVLDRFRPKPTTQDLEDKLDQVKIEDEISSHQKDIAEREAIQKELKRKYGRNWMHILGVDRLTDLATLRTFLKGAKQGMERSAGQNRFGSNNSFSTNPQLKTGAGDTAIGQLSKTQNYSGVHKA